MGSNFIVYRNNNEKYDIRFDMIPNSKEISEIQQKLYIEAEYLSNIIKSLHKTKDEIKEKYFNKLLSLSQVGLVGEFPQTLLSLKSLEKLKEEIVLVEGQRIKNIYMRDLGITALIITIIFSVFYFLCIKYENIKFLSEYCVVIIGLQIGVWISFGARKFNIKIEELSLMEKDMMNKLIRLIYIGLCSAILLLFFKTKLVTINFGKVITTEEIAKNLEIQFALGIICGLIESKIGIKIYRKTTEIIS